jgi:hypothetical protein
VKPGDLVKRKWPPPLEDGQERLGIVMGSKMVAKHAYIVVFWTKSDKLRLTPGVQLHDAENLEVVSGTKV